MQLSKKLNIETEYNIDFLIKCLEDNKAAHIEEFKKATEAYLKKRKELALILQSAVEALVKKPEQDNSSITLAYTKIFNLKIPVDATKMYDSYIKLLRTSSAKTITMSLSDANAIIEDQWEWAVAAKTTNSFYLGGF